MSAALEQLKPETIAILENQAKTFGLSLDEYIRSLLPKTGKSVKNGSKDDEFEADMLAFSEGTENLSTHRGTYSREDIYFDHD